MLLAHNLSKRFGSRGVFRGVSFEVESGQVAAVVGRNGAGKSTLLRIVAGLTAPSSGEVLWQSQTPDPKPESPRNHCGLFAPDAALYAELTALENLQFFARARGLKRDEGALMAHLERFALDKRRDDLAGELSSGLRARLKLAVATLHAPLILLLDEPSANLDDAGRALLQDVLSQQRARGLALLATNDARDLASCDARIEL